MTKTLKNHASLRGVSNANDEARLSRFHIRTEECQGSTFNLLSQLTEFKRGHSAHVATLTGFAALNRLDCRAHIRSLAMTQRVAFTMAARLARASRECRTQCKLVFCELSKTSRNHTLDPSKTLAFTMAEILLSLTIIGVVAAITLPSLMANINERTWNTQRKALYARMSQAIAMMPQVGGYGTLTEDESGSVTADTAAESFLTEGLSKVLKINNICDSEHLADCGVPGQVVDINGSAAFSAFPKTMAMLNSMFDDSYSWITDSSVYVESYSQIDTKVVAFETQNGESVALFYNPNCKQDSYTFEYVQPLVCANFIYDLNGSVGPNSMNKDIGFMTALYPVDTVLVAPVLASGNIGNVVGELASELCMDFSAESRLPNRDEVVSLFVNKVLIGMDGLVSGGPVTNLWSATRAAEDGLWDMNFVSGKRNIAHTNRYPENVMCIKR